MSDDIFARLVAPFDPALISWRPGSTTKDKTKARALAYIDARDVMRRLDEVVGPANWQDRYIPMPNGTTCCEIGLRIDKEWIWKANGAGNTDIEGEKGGYSDAFKRAAVLWGIGQYLYDIDSPWVRINEFKQIEKDELPKLQALLRGEKPKSAYQARKEGGDAAYQNIEKALRAAAKRGPEALAAMWKQHQDTIKTWPDGWRQAITDEKDTLKQQLAQSEAA